MARNRRIFYVVIIASILIALFVSVLLGLIVFIGDVIFYFYLGRSAKKAIPPESTFEENARKNDDLHFQETAKIPCKYCKTLVDPAVERTCPNCGAPIET